MLNSMMAVELQDMTMGGEVWYVDKLRGILRRMDYTQQSHEIRWREEKVA
jgi:hypothetical protein